MFQLKFDKKKKKKDFVTVKFGSPSALKVIPIV